MACENSSGSCRCVLHLPVDEIRWKKRAPRIVAAVTAVAALGGCVATAEAAQRPTLDPTLQCDIYTVKPGDWMSKIALKNGLTAQELIARNPHIPDPNRIYVGDEVVVRCLPRKPTITPTTVPAPTTTVAPPPLLEVNAMQSAPKPLAVVEWPGAMPFIPGEQVLDGVVSQSLVLRALHNQGARGNQLIGLAAITEGESNRRLDAEGDQHLADRTYGPSIGIFQVRSMKALAGTGQARDADALRGNLEHQAWAAIQVYNGALAAGRDPLSPWTCHLVGNDRAFVAPYTELADKMGLLR